MKKRAGAWVRGAVMMAAAWLVMTGCKPSGAAGGGAGEGGGGGSKRLMVGFLPKSKGNAYFVSCREGAESAAKDLGVELVFDGPVSPDPARQSEIVENWISLGMDAMAVACENKDGISTALRKARAKGIPVVTFDADALADARDYFVNQATPEGIGNALMDEAARLCGGSGQFAIITASLTAQNMVEWQRRIEARRVEKHPGMTLVALRPCDDLKDRAQAEATTLMGAHPDLRLIMAICSPAVPGTAEAVKQAGKAGKVRVIGLGLPSENRRYLKEGVTDTVFLWKTADLGGLAVRVATGLARGEMKAGLAEFDAGPMGKFPVRGTEVILGEPFRFTRENVDQFNF